MQPLYPPSGMPFHPGTPGGPALEDLTDWGKLCKGQALGKSVIIASLGSESANYVAPSPVSMLQLQGEDKNSLNLCVTLAPPKFLVITPDQIANAQNLSGFQSVQDVPPASVNAFTWPALSAIVEWGIGGTSQRAIVDYENGATVNVAGSYLRVWGQIEFQYAVDLNTNAAFQLAAQVSAGWARGGAGSRRTLRGFSLANTASAVQAVPAFARRARLVGYNGGPPNLPTLTMQFLNGPQGSIVGEAYFSSNTQDPIDLPGSAMYFQVVDTSGQLSGWSAVFELSI